MNLNCARSSDILNLLCLFCPYSFGDLCEVYNFGQSDYYLLLNRKIKVIFFFKKYELHGKQKRSLCHFAIFAIHKNDLNQLTFLWTNSIKLFDVINNGKYRTAPYIL